MALKDNIWFIRGFILFVGTIFLLWGFAIKPTEPTVSMAKEDFKGPEAALDTLNALSWFGDHMYIEAWIASGMSYVGFIATFIPFTQRKKIAQATK